MKSIGNNFLKTYFATKTCEQIMLNGFEVLTVAKEEKRRTRLLLRYLKVFEM